MAPDAVRLEQLFLLGPSFLLFLTRFGSGRFRGARLGFRRFLLRRFLGGGRRGCGLCWLGFFLLARGLLRRLWFVAGEDVVPVVGELLR